MRKVHQPSPDPPAPRSRSDSFVRMLELEKMCKMKRILHDHDPSTSTSSTPRAPFSSVIAHPLPQRSRRASDYPPLSHQTQIMKAVRRSAALPSLSLSIPPSPAQVMTRPEGSVEELSLGGERTKTVTFSEPEGEDLSDDSSICQSPSWEQYSQKKKGKKKQQKKGVDRKGTKEKPDAAPKRKSNRLSKLPPHNPFTARSLTVSDRSISAPELGTSVQSNKMNSSSTTEMRGELVKRQTLPAESASTTKDKRKSKGFLSGFRLQHGNVTAVQKLIDARKDTAKGSENLANEAEPLRSIQYETIPVQQPNILKSKKPPSIRSVVSTSDHSLSSQEKKGLGAHTSMGSGLGRSQSLLSSTLSKLRGPSYLYHQPLADGSTSDHSRNNDNLLVVGVEQGNPAGQSEQPVESIIPSLGHPQQQFDFAFPPKPRRVNTEPGPDIAPRGRQPRLRQVDIQSPGVDQEIPALKPSGSRRVQIEAPQASTRDAMMAMVAAHEKQSQAAHPYRQPRSNTVTDRLMIDVPKDSGMGGKHTVSRNHKDEINRPLNPHKNTVNVSITGRVAQGEAKVAAVSDRNHGLDIVDGHIPEDDQVSVDTYTSTIRPTSHQTTSRLGSPDFHNNATASEMSEGQGIGVEKSIGDLITFDRDIPDALQQPLQPHREVDYFSSFSESYSPPILGLRLPSDNEPLSTQLQSPEESDEDGGHGVPKDHVRSINDKQRVVANERDLKTLDAFSLNSKETSSMSFGQEKKGSPAISSQFSDSDVPAFERLGISSKTAKVLVGTEMISTSTIQSQPIDPSRTTSERSSSSTCDDSPPSPSSATTPNSSRPQSRKGVPISDLEASQNALLGSMSQTDSALSRTSTEDQLSERIEELAPRRTNPRANLIGDDWTEVATAKDLKLKQQSASTPSRGAEVSSSPSLVASPTAVSFADIVRKDLDDEEDRQDHVLPFPPRTQSALDLRTTTKLAQQPSRSQRLHLKSSAVASSVSLPSSPPDITEMPRKSALKMSRNNSTNGLDSSTPTSMGAAYLQEARKAVSVASASSSRALRPRFPQHNSSGSIGSAVSAGSRAEPLAKMLVECCNCHFFHDMPSRVYECMAKPDSVVEDKSLGVSAAITTMVRCPWCAHGMTTQCCSGYAAVVYLKEKLHGK
ncbi:hypothetical protein F5B22DRAFT_539698 [Xylaria bambusicola]|uniref:uncharacterized protein n=1 Tax=Xylaria bambusicola TaxID=326684 RepID=UPI00200869E2|nr:uncharacterized protein F5B22DRAFT_539698 [Xylaria bambusicola]KAI0521481.1 hypothetical protein F5B22DRAFT_539698 [Xylaria bambusicola]